MLSTFTSTWIIAAFLFGILALFSVLSPSGASQGHDYDAVSSEYPIEADKMSAGRSLDLKNQFTQN
ncbi:MAG: hypothetical protein JKY12_08390 [Sneathiella sp.]|nr:hypothetical protein [Sneathiella sp.]